MKLETDGVPLEGLYCQAQVLSSNASQCRSSKGSDSFGSLEGSQCRVQCKCPREIAHDPLGIPLFIEIPLLSSTPEQAMALALPDSILATKQQDDKEQSSRIVPICKHKGRQTRPRARIRDKAPKSIRRSFTPPVTSTSQNSNLITLMIPRLVDARPMFFFSVDIEPRAVL